MSIIANYHRLSPEKFQQLRSDPKAAASYFGDDLEDEDDGWYAFLDARDVDGRYLTIWKNWHGLHFLLTGNESIEIFDPANPLETIINGGATTEWEAGYGVVQYLTTGEVKAIADAVDSVDEEQIRSRYDVVAFRANDIYPLGDEWQDSHIEWLVDAFHKIKQFMRQAADAGEMVLLSLN